MNRLIVWHNEDIDDLKSKVVGLWMDMVSRKNRKNGICKKLKK